MTVRRRADVVEQTARAYSAHAEDFLRRWGRRTYKLPPLLRDWLKQLPQGSLVLDLGCGAGQDARYLASRRHRVVGLDRTRPLLEFARRRAHRLPLVQADMRRLPFRVRSFDAVWAAASLIHLPKPAARRLFRDLGALVPPGGWLAATVAHGRAAGCLRRGWIPGRYFSRWSKDALARAFRRAGWEIITLKTVTGRERKGRWLNLLARRRSA
ncbi:MAG: class I SAM-dependent methyltransferase [Nitrospira sp.]